MLIFGGSFPEACFGQILLINDLELGLWFVGFVRGRERKRLFSQGKATI